MLLLLTPWRRRRRLLLTGEAVLREEFSAAPARNEAAEPGPISGNVDEGVLKATEDW